MTLTPRLRSQRSLLVNLTLVAALAALTALDALAGLDAWTSPFTPMAEAASVTSNSSPPQASSLWPAPAAPLDNTPIGPMETVGAAANE